MVCIILHLNFPYSKQKWNGCLCKLDFILFWSKHHWFLEKDMYPFKININMTNAHSLYIFKICCNKWPQPVRPMPVKILKLSLLSSVQMSYHFSGTCGVSSLALCYGGLREWILNNEWDLRQQLSTCATQDTTHSCYYGWSLHLSISGIGSLPPGRIIVSIPGRTMSQESPLTVTGVTASYFCVREGLKAQQKRLPPQRPIGRILRAVRRKKKRLLKVRDQQIRSPDHCRASLSPHWKEKKKSTTKRTKELSSLSWQEIIKRRHYFNAAPCGKARKPTLKCHQDASPGRIHSHRNPAACSDSASARGIRTALIPRDRESPEKTRPNPRSMENPIAWFPNGGAFPAQSDPPRLWKPAFALSRPDVLTVN